MSKLELFDKSTLKKTEQRVREMQENGEIDFPPNYSPQNALKSMWLELQSTKDKDGKPVLESCSKSSVMETMLDTVIQGLNPSKNQVYPIAYGKKLVAQRSYFGSMALAKQVDNVKDIRPSLIHEDDTVSIEKKNGQTIVDNHETSWENRQKPLVGVYVVIEFADDRPDKYTLMTKDEVESAWAQRRGKDKSKAHKNFDGEMFKKTATHRACKPIINSSDDANLLAGKPEFTREQAHERQVEAEKDDEANSEVVDLEPEEEEVKEELKEKLDEAEEELEEDKSEGEKQGKLLDDEESDIEKQPDF